MKACLLMAMQLSKEQKKALLVTSQELFTYVNGLDGELNYTEYALIRIIEYWSNAPVDYA